ncbi:MAG TPA: VOC family protein [Kofleriaceae bacterium]|nr:VOC family protein [Kofleriaceae bacterium]
MIRGLHGLFYSSEVDAMRAFLRDVLRLPFTDVGQGWLIFDLPEADIGVHPVDDEASSGKHDLSFYCDDIAGTVADLRARGATFDGDIEDHGYGLVTYFTMPGNVRVQLYEPRYEKKRARAAARQARARPARRAAKPAARAVAPARAAGRAKAKPGAKATKAKGKARPKAGARARRR